MKKLSLLLLSMMMTLSLVGCQTKNKKEEQIAFDKFINESFIEELKDDYLSVHLDFEHPENYGIDKSQIDVSLGQRIDEDTFDVDMKELKEKNNMFKKFDRDLLTDEQQDTYDIYQSQLDASKRSLKKEYQYVGSVFEDGNGIQVQLTSVFEHFPIREEQDAADLITLVKDVKPYIESAISYTKKQVEKGTLMINIDSVNEYCQKIVDKGMASSLLTTMKTNIDALGIDSSQKTSYKQQLETVFKESFIVGYQAIIDGLNSLNTSKNNKEGLYALKNGKEYYEILVQNSVGSSQSIKDIKKMLQETSNKYLKSLLAASQANSNAYDEVDNFQTKYHDYETMLTDLSRATQNSFPEVKNLNYQIKAIDPEVVSGSIGAYFVVPAIDQSTPMQIRVNSSSNDLSINDPSVFTTVAHEGITGHMYQNAYVRQKFTSQIYRVFVSCNNAYSEGYAKYVELLSYDYIDGLSQEGAEILRANDIYTYLQIVLSDIGIHYEGWDVAEFQKYLKEKGLTLDDEQAQSQYDQLQANPGMFIPYFVGFCEFDQLREKAENKLGSQFNEKNYHEAILKSGEAPFSVVEKNVKDYISSVK